MRGVLLKTHSLPETVTEESVSTIQRIRGIVLSRRKRTVSGVLQATGQLRIQRYAHFFLHLSSELSTDSRNPTVTLRLLSTLESLLSAPLTPNPHQSSTTQLLTSALSLVQGSLLMHPPSRTLFAQERYMNILLDLFDDEAAPSVQSGALLVLVCAMLDHPRNIRTFERLDGVWQVTHLFKVRSTTREVKRAVIEFLYFYLMPEGLEDGKGWVRAAMATATGAVGAKGRGRGDTVRRSQKEKQELLRMHLTHVDDLVGDLQQGSGPFGEAR